MTELATPAIQPEINIELLFDMYGLVSCDDAPYTPNIIELIRMDPANGETIPL